MRKSNFPAFSYLFRLSEILITLKGLKPLLGLLGLSVCLQAEAEGDAGAETINVQLSIVRFCNWLALRCYETPKEFPAGSILAGWSIRRIWPACPRPILIGGCRSFGRSIISNPPRRRMCARAIGRWRRRTNRKSLRRSKRGRPSPRRWRTGTSPLPTRR